jgi:hypothetical protein
MTNPTSESAKPVAPEDYSAFSNLAMLVKRLVHRYRQLDPHDPISADVLKFLRECGGMGTPFRAAPIAQTADARDTERWRALRGACKSLIAASEEYDFDDGLGVGILQDAWDEFQTAVDAAAAPAA